jgi:hypothetical protein
MGSIAILCSGGDDISQKEVRGLTFFESKARSVKTIGARGED